MALLGVIILTLPLEYNWSNYTHVRDWIPTSANVIWLGELCEMHEVWGKNSKFVDAIDCKQVRPWREAHKKVVNGRQRYFRPTPTEYAVVLVDPSDGPIRQVKVRQSVASFRALSVGDTVEILYNPNNPSQLDRVYRWYEYKYSILYYAGLIWSVASFVRFAVRARRKKREAQNSVTELAGA
jgi:hypothetical protein